MQRSWLFTLASTQAVLCAFLSAASAPAADGGSNQHMGTLLNNQSPVPDSFFTQSVKPVVARLKGQVCASQQMPPSAAKDDVPTISEKYDTTSTMATGASVPSGLASATQVVAQPLPPDKQSSSTVLAAILPLSPPPNMVATPNAPVVPVQGDSTGALSLQLNALLTAAQKLNPEWQKAADAVERYADWKRRLMERSHDMINYAVLFKGVSPSSEGGDVILGEKSKLKGIASAKYMCQKLSDEAELQLTSATIELAGGLGNPDALEGQSQISESMSDLTRLAGKDAADGTMALLKKWQAQDTAPAASVSKPLWSIADGKAHVEQAVATAAMSDTVIADIRDDVHHYNQHSQGTMAAHRIARTALSAASLSPNLIGPAAQVVLFTYITVTGGTEQDKLLRELYIDKRLNSRVNLLGEQAHMAFYNYQLGALTQNNLLMNCSRQLLSRLCGSETANKLISPLSNLAQTGDKQSVSTRP